MLRYRGLQPIHNYPPHSTQLSMYVSGVASDPLCRDRYPRFQETKSNLPPTVVRVRSELIEGCQARQSTDPHKLRGSKPQQGSLTSVLDTHGPRQSLGFKRCARAGQRRLWLGFSSAMLQICDHRALDQPLPTSAIASALASQYTARTW